MLTNFLFWGDAVRMGNLMFTYAAGTNQIASITENGITKADATCNSDQQLTTAIGGDANYIDGATLTAMPPSINGSKQVVMEAADELILESGFDFNATDDGEFLGRTIEDCLPKGVGFEAATTTYTYDDNGNLITDSGKGITISYNHLNLPYKIVFGAVQDGNTIEWLYDAAGMKLRKTVTANNVVRYTQDYMGGIEYQNSEVEAIYHAEGRATLEADGTFLYEYTLKDHLGNSRVTFADRNQDNSIESNEILQESHYYPFGMNIDRLSETYSRETNDYLYNGIERNRDFGLNIDFAFYRSYDATTGRWWQIDPKGEVNYFDSPYSSMKNNPIRYVDPLGDIVLYAGSTEETEYNNYRKIVKDGITKYDEKTKQLRDNGKNKRADRRERNRANNVYVQIDGELDAIEISKDVFRTRYGDNATSTENGGNIAYNSDTREIDINLSKNSDYTITQRLSHELLHAHQYLEQELDLSANGGWGILYDRSDEVAAFQRQNLFTPLDGTEEQDIIELVNRNYSDIPVGPISLNNLPPKERETYLKEISGRNKGGLPQRFFTGKWRNF